MGEGWAPQQRREAPPALAARLQVSDTQAAAPGGLARESWSNRLETIGCGAADPGRPYSRHEGKAAESQWH